jgi:hypothetical protein
VASAIAILVLSCGALAAGWGYVRTARRMRLFRTTPGTVVARELATLSGGHREGRWGKGGNYRAKVTYTYAVDGVSYTSDRSSYAHRGFRRGIAEQQLAAIPDEVTVHYDPAAPEEAFLERHTPTIGYVLLAGGAFGAMCALIWFVA